MKQIIQTDPDRGKNPDPSGTQQGSKPVLPFLPEWGPGLPPPAASSWRLVLVQAPPPIRSECVALTQADRSLIAATSIRQTQQHLHQLAVHLVHNYTSIYYQVSAVRM